MTKARNKKIIFLSIIILILILLVLKPVQVIILNIASKMLGQSLDILEWGFQIRNFSLSILIGLVFFIPGILELKKSNLQIETDKTDRKSKVNLYIFFFIISVVGIAFCSTTSFLYSFHNYDDAHCFFTVGKSVLNEKVLYKDIYEQKGPMLYFIHTIASIISSKSFLGVYFLQVISSFFFLVYSYKIISLFSKKNDVKFILVIIWAIIISSYNYICGDTVEELSFALITIPLYFSIKNIKLDTDFSKKEMFLSGLFAGIIFWMKYTLVGFFFGWAIIPVYRYIKKQEIKKLFQCILFLVLGVLTATLPVFIYCISTDSLTDLIQVYFIDNIFSYAAKSTHSNILVNKFCFLVLSFGKMCVQNPFDTILLIFSIISIFFFYKGIKRELKIHIVLCYLLAFFFIYIGGVRFAYYSLILSVFLIFAVPVFENFIEYFKYKNNVFAIISCVFVLVIIFTLSSGWKNLGNKKETYPQYEMAKIINESKTDEYKPTLLNFGVLDFGIYFTSDIVPSEKYFAWLNVDCKEMKESQNSCIQEKRVDYITTRFEENRDIILSYDTYDLVYSKESYYLFMKK